MGTPNLESHTERNKKTSSKFYGFHSFAEAGFTPSLNGAFRDNIRQFLLQCAEPEDYELDGMPIWCTLLVYENKGTVIPLYTIEENVKHSDNPFCDYCRCAGWSHHFVSQRKYHLIIPVNDDWNNRLDEGAFDIQTHLLHGLIHCNGYGHLICVNGIEGGSNYISGRDLMDLWDRICTTLHARQVSVEDLSRKHKMDLRLLHGVAYGQSWFGRWGYRFCHGSFGVKEHNYQRAVEILSSLDLDQVIDDFSLTNECTIIKHMILHYRGMSDTNLVTLRDLFRFMLTLKKSTSFKQCSIKSKLSVRNCSPGKDKKPVKCRKFSNLAANLDSRWPVRRLLHVAQVIVEALKEKRAKNKASSSGMTRQEARDAARIHIGDTGLIDHVLKAMNNVVIGNYVVRRAANKKTKILEYTIQEFKGGKENIHKKVPGPIQKLTRGLNVYDDIIYLYKNVLLDYPDSDLVRSSVRMILYSKHFVKEWPFSDEDDDSLRFICRLTKSAIDMNDFLSCDFPSHEFVTVPLFATLGDLKLAVQNVMRDTYCVTEKLIVTEVLEMDGVEDEEVLFGLIESGREIWVRGFGFDLGSELRYEGGTENWTVRCKCGARDDDGERMVSCDICEIWQHTCCSGIEDSEAVPRFFVCDTCCNSLAPEQRHCGFMYNDDCDLYDPMMLPEVDMGMLYSD